MSARIPIDRNLVCIGIDAFHTLSRALVRDLGDEAARRLQEAGYAAGGQVYQGFLQWLPEHTGVAEPGGLDAAVLGEVLSAYFEQLGWGRLTVERAGNKGLAIKSTNWAEARQHDASTIPSCFITCGMFADFFGRMSGIPVAVLELECQSRNDGQCGFLVGSPETMDAVYEALAEGADYNAALALT